MIERDILIFEDSNMDKNDLRFKTIQNDNIFINSFSLGVYKSIYSIFLLFKIILEIYWFN